MNLQPKRKNLRLKDYDYSEAGAYFVTVCTKGRKCWFGNVVEGKMKLNDAGRMVEKFWKELPHRFPPVELDEFVVMPNHMHGIIVLNETVGAHLVCARDQRADTHRAGTTQRADTTQRAGTTQRADTTQRAGTDHRADTRSAPTLGDIIRAFKSITTVEYIRGVRERRWPPFPGQLWQRNYYERVIRNETELFETHQYIQENPLKWDLDPENPHG